MTETDFIKQLTESGLLDEESKQAVQEAWNKKLKEQREEVASELREEFARRYEHDKSVMVEAADKMVTEALNEELKEFRQERKQLREAKAKYQKMIKEHSRAIRNFANEKLANEIKELREDRDRYQKAVQKFEQFAVKKLTNEIREFHEDKQELVNQKVRLVNEAKRKLNESKKNFIKRAATVVESTVENSLQREIKQFRNDIEQARKNNFGRRIFEAFAAEFMTSHLSEGTEAKKLQRSLQERDNKLKEYKKTLEKQQSLLEQSNQKAKMAEDRVKRERKLSELLDPLPKEKREIMGELLESVKTENLDAAYKKHIKYVLNEGGQPQKSRQTLKENNQKSSRSEVTGNRKPVRENTQEVEVDQSQLDNLRRLAGIR